MDSGAGTGKTYSILTVLHTLAADYPNLRILICRATRASLTESVMVTFEQEILPADGMTWLARGARRDVRKAYNYPNKSTIVLGGLDRPDRILSTAWDVVYVNECVEVTEEAWDALWGRLNRPGRPGWLGYLIGDTNPGDPGHWIKKRADEGRVGRWQVGHRANPVMWDGSAWTAAGTKYLDGLRQLVGTRRKRFLDGVWAAGEGAWFGTFDIGTHVDASAEFDPRYPVHLSVDTGVHTGAAWWQPRGDGDDAEVTVFGDYYSFDVHAFENAKAVLALTQTLCGGRFDVGRRDPSGGAASGFGSQTIDAEFRRAGLRLEPWPKYPGCVTAGLNLLESFVACDPPRFKVHPRCTRLIEAMTNYRRKKRGGQFIDEPEDPLHPHEELVDSMRSGLLDRWPEGRRPQPKLRRVPARRVF
jgi:hypothetical protein